MARYVEPAELAKHVRRYRRTKEFSQGLIQMFRMMATGIQGRFKYARDVEEFRQETFLWILRTDAMRHADPNGNLFGYFTKVMQSCGRSMRSQTDREYAMNQRYVEEFTANGMPPVATPETFETDEGWVVPRDHETRRPAKKRRSKAAKRKAGGSYRVTEVTPQCQTRKKKPRKRPRMRQSDSKECGDKRPNSVPLVPSSSCSSPADRVSIR